MTTKQIYFLLVFCVTLFFSCVNNPNEQLTKANEIIDHHPDSALLILDSIPFNQITGDADKALYGLLYTQALDKLHQNPTNDSLITFASNYYKRNNETLSLAKSEYYSGRVYFHNENYNTAIVKFFSAKVIATDNKHYLWAGLACRGISDIYCKFYNSADELKFAKLEYEYTKLSNSQPYINYALFDLGRAMHNNAFCDSSIAISYQLADSANITNDQNLNYLALQLRSISYLYNTEYQNAYNTFKEIFDTEFSNISDSLNYCLTLSELNKTDEAIKLISNLSDYQIPLKNDVLYKVYRKASLFENALYELEYIDSVTNSIFKEAMSNNLSSTIVDYYEYYDELNDAKMKTANTKLWLVIVFSFSIIICILSLGYLFFKRQQQTIVDKIQFAEELNDSLSHSLKENSQASSIIQNLLESKFEILDQLSQIVSHDIDSKVSKHKIADTITKLINSFYIQGSKIEELQNQVNILHNNIISDFYNDFPNLKEADYHLFLFSVINISIPTIAFFLKEDKITAVYDRKRRLKDKIKQSNCSNYQRYLDAISN